MDKIDRIISLAKRRGFIFQSSEIYGGLSGVYDYGPLGVELKNNIKRLWWQDVVEAREDVVGLDAAIIMPPKVWVASGHLEHFVDPLRECKECHKRFRADDLENTKKCPVCGGKLGPTRIFNILVETHLGPVKDTAHLAYLRGETAQGIFVNFENVRDTMRLKIPFGIAQIGKAFRNEITPGNFLFRLREFEQMELEYFIKPGQQAKWFSYWKKERMAWYESLGIKKDNLRFYKHKKKELAHYADMCEDIEYKFPWGWGEQEGIASRRDYDLSQHSKISGEDLSYFDPQENKKYIPYVIEPSAGVDRLTLILLLDAYDEEEVRGQKRTLLRFSPKIAPVKVAVLPLVRNKKELTAKAREVYNKLSSKFSTMYDEVGSIGRRYRRQDEVGTFVSVTTDFQTIKDSTVTLRDRDTMAQIRIGIAELQETIQKILNGEEFLKLGQPVK